jgi:hypothetical protein
MAALSVGVYDTSNRNTEYFPDEGAPLVGIFDVSNPKISISDACAKLSLFIQDDLKIQLFHAKRHFNKPPSASSMKKIGLDIDEVGNEQAFFAFIVTLKTSLNCVQATSIFLYTSESPLYGSLNTLLRSSDRKVP